MDRSIYKYVAVIVSICYIYPFVEIISLFLWSGTANMGIFGFLAMIVCSFICLEVSRTMQEKSNNKGIAIGLSILISVIVSVLFATISGIGGLPVFVFIVGCFITGYSAFKANHKELRDILKKKRVISMTITLVIMLFLINFLMSGETLPVLRSSILIVFVVSCIGSMFVMNRELLESLFKQKSTDAREVSDAIQIYNTKVIVLYSIIFLIVFSLRGAVRYFLEATGMAAMMAAYNSMLEIKTPAGSIREGEMEVADVLNAGIGENTRINAELINKVIMYIVAGVLVVIGIILLRIIIRNAPVQIRLFIKKIRDLFAKILGLGKNKNKAGDADFIDEVEDISKGDFEDARKYDTYKNAKKVRKIKDPVEKLRAFYGFFMYSLKKNNVPIYVSDTTYQISDKSMLVSNLADETNTITEMYNEVRYADLIPDENTIDKVDAYITNIVKSCKPLKMEEEVEGINGKKKKKNKR